MAGKKSTCERVQRGIAGKTRDEIMDALCAEFDLPRPKIQIEQPGAKPKPKKPPRKAKS